MRLVCALFLALVVAAHAEITYFDPVNPRESQERLTVTEKLSVSGELIYTNTVWDDMTLSPQGLARAGNSDPDISYASGPSGKLMSTLFDANSDQELFDPGTQTRHRRKFGSDVHCHFHIQPTTANTGAVVMAVEYTWTQIGSVESSTTITNSCTNSIVAGTAWEHYLVEPEAPINGTGKGGSSMIKARFWRDADNPADTYPNDINLMSVDYHYEMDKAGSPEEIPDDV